MMGNGVHSSFQRASRNAGVHSGSRLAACVVSVTHWAGTNNCDRTEYTVNAVILARIALAERALKDHMLCRELGSRVVDAPRLCDRTCRNDSEWLARMMRPNACIPTGGHEDGARAISRAPSTTAQYVAPSLRGCLAAYGGGGRGEHNQATHLHLRRASCPPGQPLPRPPQLQCGHPPPLRGAEVQAAAWSPGHGPHRRCEAPQLTAVLPLLVVPR